MHTVLSHRNSANKRLWPSSQTNTTILIRTQWKGLQGMTKVALVFDVQLLSCVWLFGTPWTAARQVSLSFTISQSLLKIRSIESMMPSNYLTLCRPLLLLPSIFPSIRVFSHELALPIGGQSIGASAAASVLPMNIQSWYLLGLTGLISLLSKGHSRVLSSSTIWRHQFFRTQPFIWSNFHIHTWLMEKPYFWLYGPLLAKWCLCFLLHYLNLS